MSQYKVPVGETAGRGSGYAYRKAASVAIVAQSLISTSALSDIYVTGVGA